MNEITTRQESSLVKVPKMQLTYLDAIRAIDAITPDDRTALATYGMTAAQAKMVMWTGFELGLTFTGALRVMYVSKQGKIVLRPIGALALIQGSGLLEKYEWQGDGKKQTIIMKRQGRPERRMSLTIEEALTAGWKSDAWVTTPANMLRWRLIGWLSDLDWTDLTIGLPTANDSWMDIEITADGDVIDLQATELPPVSAPSVTIDTAPSVQPGTTPEAPTVPQIPNYDKSLADLFKTTSQDEIIEAYNGKSLPITSAQVNITWHNLVKAGKIVEVVTDLNETAENE